ncbi:hypothetical protein HHK36_030831 [Tetracentron sinense]|uniref:Uncharacterized protein n=1 Tax=Tetracentron sinense TaxID=13715 RepID=A0A834YDH2_TETSI|nr:hypothetical protein HHK36_030831 [Tetracentron sinense]
MEEANICGTNQLDADVRLPPRKRLLAGLKRQNCDSASPLSLLSSFSSDFSSRLRDLMSSILKSAHNSLEEIVDASRSAAAAAAKVAAAARAAAEEKAAVAAKAAAAAKSALELLASVSEKKTCKKGWLMKNGPKKHVPVKLLYKKRQRIEEGETDVELARRLHRAMNSSPRISKNSLSSDCKTHNDMKHKKLTSLERTKVSSGGVEGNLPYTCDRNSESDDVGSGGSFQDVDYMSKVDEQASKCSKADYSKMDKFHADGDAEASHSTENHWRTDTGMTSRKRAKIKRKKLSLSLCTIRDRAHSKDTEVEATSISKRKEFKSPQCFADSNIRSLHVQSLQS